MKIIWIMMGSIFVAIGSIGIVVPGLPSTPFFLLASFCYMRSSRRLYQWLLSRSVIGRMLRDYQEHKGVTAKTKVIAITMMTVFLTVSAIFFIPKIPVKLAVITAGIIGVIVILKIKTIKGE